MALRVLLADESSTIKKVIQLALQDYGVQVKTVSVGVDALDVARSFSPDIVFADILLQKKSGYDVCSEIKKDRVLSSTPVILMWSGFLELDDKQFKLSSADDQLEKPFNVETLRSLIQKWVPKTSTQEMSDFLEYPTSIRSLTAGSEVPPAIGAAKPAALPGPDKIVALPSPSPHASESAAWDSDTFEDIRNFTDLGGGDEITHISTGKVLRKEPVPLESEGPESDEPWLTKDLSKFRLNIPEGENSDTLSQIQRNPIENTAVDISLPENLDDLSTAPKLNSEELERLLRAQSREIIESVVWKIVPELAGTIIREELNRLLKEEDVR